MTENSNPTQPAIPAPVLEIRDLVKIYDGQRLVLDRLSLAVAKSEVLAIIGPSGCGKSTLLRCLNGLEEIQGGSIALDGQVIASAAEGEKVSTDWNKIRQRVGMVFQSYDLFPHLSVLENLLLAPLKVRGEQRAEATARAQALLERVGLGDRADAYPDQLSGGQKQRVAIVRALMMQPEVLLLDEITASLDPEMVREVLDVVAGLAEEGMTMLIVTHEMAFARAVADRVIFLDGGKILEQGPAEDFFASPQTERAAQFLNIFTFEKKEKGANYQI